MPFISEQRNKQNNDLYDSRFVWLPQRGIPETDEFYFFNVNFLIQSTRLHLRKLFLSASQHCWLIWTFERFMYNQKATVSTVRICRTRLTESCSTRWQKGTSSRRRAHIWRAKEVKPHSRTLSLFPAGLFLSAAISTSACNSFFFGLDKKCKNARVNAQNVSGSISPSNFPNF